ncbi:MAG: phytase [Duganella sp.]
MTPTLLTALIATTLATALTAAIAPARAATLPNPATLPDGNTLALDKTALRLLGPDGAERARLTVRARHLDTRPLGANTLAVIVDANEERAVPVIVDTRAGTLTAQAPFPAPAFGIEAACLYRDAEQLDHLFLVAKDGQAEQWVMQGDLRLQVRKLALPPNSKHCHADDARHQLLVNEAGAGVWSYNADAEGVPGRKAVPPKKAGARDAPRAPINDARAIVMPRGQTAPVARTGDAADDPAIWVHPSDPNGARILGTNKKQGLLVYDLQGKQLQLLEVGRLNNVDVRQNVKLGHRTLDVAVATQRDDNSVIVFAIDAGGVVSTAGAFATGLKDIYGMCLYRPADGGVEAFVNDKDGTFLHYRIEAEGNGVRGTLLRRFKVATQPEGCVVDDRNARLFLGEERRGVWTVAASGDAPARLEMIMPVGPQLAADVEGMALYHGERQDYLVVSSQGDNSYLVLDARAPYRVRGSFRVGYNLAAGIDGTSETDGLEVSSANFGGPYGKGMLVIQDGYKRLPDGPQNFKYVAWDDVAKALKLD